MTYIHVIGNIESQLCQNIIENVNKKNGILRDVICYIIKYEAQFPHNILLLIEARFDDVVVIFLERI